VKCRNDGFKLHKSKISASKKELIFFYHILLNQRNYLSLQTIFELKYFFAIVH